MIKLRRKERFKELSERPTESFALWDVPKEFAEPEHPELAYDPYDPTEPSAEQMIGVEGNAITFVPARFFGIATVVSPPFIPPHTGAYSYDEIMGNVEHNCHRCKLPDPLPCVDCGNPTPAVWRYRCDPCFEKHIRGVKT